MQKKFLWRRELLKGKQISIRIKNLVRLVSGSSWMGGWISAKVMEPKNVGEVKRCVW